MPNRMPGKLVPDLMAVEVIGERQPAKPAFCREEHQKRVKDHILGKQRHDKRERTGQIVGENADKFAAERAGKRIDQTCVSKNRAP